MHGAQVANWGEAPKFVEVNDPLPSEPDDTKAHVRVAAVGLHNLVKSRASGKHYSAKTLPHVPGVDGVGQTEDGQEVYFITHPSGKGSFVESLNIERHDIFPLPSGLDKLQVAAYVNPAMSSWMALKRRATSLPSRFTVVILGATTASGRIAVSISKLLGAGKVIGCARNSEALSRLNLDKAVLLNDPMSNTDFSDIGEVDVILDYIFGPAAVHLLQSLKPSHDCQYIQIGGMAARDITLNGSILRSKKLSILGSGIGSFSDSELRAELPHVLHALEALDPLPISVFPLRDVERAWNSRGAERIVFTI